MDYLQKIIEANIPLYYLLAFINCIVGIVTCILAAVIFTKRMPTHKLLPCIVSVVLSLFAAYCRVNFYSNKSSSVYSLCVLFLFLINYICIFLFYPGKKCLKPFLVATGLVFTDALKYIFLMFLSFDFSSESDVPDLVTELIIGVLALTVILIIAVTKSGKSSTDLPQIKPDIPLYLLVLASVTVFIATIALFGINYSERTRFDFLLAISNIPLVGGTVLYAVSRLYKSKLAEESYRRRFDMQRQHFSQMEKKNEELRVFRHDFSKKLRPAVMYLSTGKTDEVMDILSEFTNEIEASRPRYSTGNFMLDTVLECQQQLAEKNGSTIVLTPGSVFPPQGIEPDDIYTIFPNALDNAIEACRSLSGENEITVSSRIAGDIVYVCVKNPCTEGIGKNTRLETTKKDKNLHGYGIKSIKKAAAKYGSDNVEYFTKDGQFNIRITLKYINN